MNTIVIEKHSSHPLYLSLRVGKIFNRKSTTENLLQKIYKFDELKSKYSTVLPCCEGKCSIGPHKGWKFSNPVKHMIRGKRKVVEMNIDLSSFKPRPMGNTEKSFQNWLTDSIPAWDQLRNKLYIDRQIRKKHKSAR